MIFVPRREAALSEFISPFSEARESDKAIVPAIIFMILDATVCFLSTQTTNGTEDDDVNFVSVVDDTVDERTFDLPKTMLVQV